MPLYVRAGAIIPVDPVRQYTSQEMTGPTTITVFPGEDGSFVMYDDDGSSLDYKRDIGTWTHFHWNERSRTLTVEPDSRTKSKSTGTRELEVLLVTTGQRKSVAFSGRKVDVKF
jgi:alpha-glucosidase/alpha-D-xyloside xylohydrolase